MLTDAIRAIHDLAHKNRVIFYYTGHFSQSIITAAGDIVRRRMESREVSPPAQRKLFAAFVEMAQNVLHYAEEDPAEAADRASSRGFGTIWLGHEAERFFVLCSNSVPIRSIAALTRVCHHAPSTLIKATT